MQEERDRISGSGKEISWFQLQLGNEELMVLSVSCVASRLDGLTPAEREVAALMLEGLSNRAIAKRRGASGRTVANQISSIFRKLGVTSRSELSALVHGGE